MVLASLSKDGNLKVSLHFQTPELRNRRLFLDLLCETGLRWSLSTGNPVGLLLAGFSFCNLLISSKRLGEKFHHAWRSIGRGVVSALNWEESAWTGSEKHVSGHKDFDRIEADLEGTLRTRFESIVQRSLNQYRISCTGCNLEMYIHHTYKHTLLTSHGHINVEIPVLRCSECQATGSGMDILGKEDMTPIRLRIT